MHVSAIILWKTFKKWLKSCTQRKVDTSCISHVIRHIIRPQSTTLRDSLNKYMLVVILGNLIFFKVISLIRLKLFFNIYPLCINLFENERLSKFTLKIYAFLKTDWPGEHFFT